MATGQDSLKNVGTKRHIKDLREYIDALRSIGELQDVAEEVDWDLEIGAIIRRVYETSAPAPLFNNVKGFPRDYRVLGAPAATGRQAGLQLARVALSLGLDPHATGREMIESLVSARQRDGIAPVRVPTAPCKENIALGDDIDLFQFPTPLIHGGDGGRYFNTWGVLIVQSPDKKWTNWTISRMMIADKNKLVGLVAPSQHLGMIHKMWSDIGKPTPFAIAQGCEPFLPFVCAMPLPAFADEADYAGAYFGEAIKVVKCETSDLEVPASAEIVVEGTISNTETASEGPMGEYAGYIWAESIEQPLFNVTAITYRNQPILPVVAAGEPIEENHTVCGITGAAETLVQLRQNGIPATMAWMPFESAAHIMAVSVPVDYRATVDCTKEELCRRIGNIVLSTKLGVQIPKIMVVHDDVDLTNPKEVTWAFATRCHPDEGEIVLHHRPVYPLSAFVTKGEKVSLDGPKSVYNCLGPEDWNNTIPRRSSFRFSYPGYLQQKVLSKWKDYGFEQ